MDDLEDLDFNIKIDEGKNTDDSSNFNTTDNTTATGTSTWAGTESQPLNQIQSQENVVSTNYLGGMFAASQNPVTCLFHVLFKGLSLAAFLFLNSICGDEIITFVMVVMFAAFDFWTVKNVTGRLLVQLRWWSEIDDYGIERWVYESDEEKVAELAAVEVGDEDAKKSLEKKTPSNAADRHIFWLFLYGSPVVWGFFLFMDIITFKFFWAITSGVCFTLALTNAQGYYLCQREHKQKLTDYI
jgi:hypothetical protein